MHIEEARALLGGYGREDIVFNEPHFSQQLALRAGNREAVVDNILNPERLVYVYEEEGSRGDVKLTLHFKISNARTMRLPVILDKQLLVLTYIMRHRHWRSMVR